MDDTEIVTITSDEPSPFMLVAEPGPAPDWVNEPLQPWPLECWGEFIVTDEAGEK